MATSVYRNILAASLFAGALPFGVVLPAARAYAAPAAARHFHLGYSEHKEAGKRAPRPGRLAALVGDRESGLGFYALPAQFRAQARLAHAQARFGSRPGDAIRYAVATEAGLNDYEVYGEDSRSRRGRALFNPVDGYGSPFFAGYYGPAGDPDEERGPFGRPYD